MKLVNRYVLDGPSLETRLGRNFPGPSRMILGPHYPLYSGYHFSFLGVKLPGSDADCSPPSSARVGYSMLCM